MLDRGVKTPVNPIVHSRREVGDALHQGQHFFSDIAREGIALYQADEKSLPKAKLLSPQEEFDIALTHLNSRLPQANTSLKQLPFVLRRAVGMKRRSCFTNHLSKLTRACSWF
jgi:hypothetical protein